MAVQILLNVVLAVSWMLLSNNLSAQGFVIGYLLGLVMLYVMRHMFKSRFYLWRIWAVIKLFGLFLSELWKANIDVVKHALKPKIDMQPAFFAYPTTLTADWEITLLSNLITLTPGTVVVHVADDSQTLYVHALDITDVDEAIESIQQSFERAILEVTRS
ncbi:Na+/H+ antiporter subunit E [Kurthia massiliensis]|uniref:Na+/H+ antiporter subunit E n=1 Tax=Kurthia massiliensis TaxID=1033739 RepID=UPI00028935F7|nr:Na+/H+ antiporter subunit E [Kurthia massiliensis]